MSKKSNVHSCGFENLLQTYTTSYHESYMLKHLYTSQFHIFHELKFLQVKNLIANKKSI